MINYSKAIKQLKKTLGMGDDALAKKLGVSGNAVWNWTAGKSKPSGKNRNLVNAELLSNNIIAEADIDGTEESKPAKKQRASRRKRTVRESAVTADKNLLKTYYAQLAAEKKISKFRVEIMGINKKHVKDIPPDVWAEIMTLIEDF